MKNTSDTAFIMMALCFILANQQSDETAQLVTSLGGVFWLLIGGFRVFRHNSQADQPKV